MYKPGGFLRSPRLTTCCNIFKICYTLRQINVMMMMMKTQDKIEPWHDSLHSEFNIAFFPTYSQTFKDL